MSYVLILQEHNYLPHAVRLEADTPTAASAEIADVVEGKAMATPQFLIELATGDVRRVFIVGDEVILADGYQSNLGAATTVDYFIKKESVGAQSCDGVSYVG